MDRNTDLTGDIGIRTECTRTTDHATASTIGVQTFVLPKAWPTVIYAHYLKTVVHEVHRWYSFINMMVQNVCLAPEKLFYPISCLEDVMVSGIFTVGRIVAHTFPAWCKRIHWRGKQDRYTPASKECHAPQ